MIFLRSLLFNFLFYWWMAIIFLMAVPLLFLPPRFAHVFAKVACGGILWLSRWIAGIRYEIRGQEYIPQKGALIASKHQSVWDTIIFQYLWPDVAFVLKKELLSIPIYGQFIRKYEMIPIDRRTASQALKSLMQGTKNVLAQQRKVVIFPEGTRTLPTSSPKYQRGIAMLYEKLNVPVVPVALNSGLFWPRRKFIRRPGKVVVEFLPPISSGLSRDDFMNELTNRIETASNKLIG